MEWLLGPRGPANRFRRLCFRLELRGWPIWLDISPIVRCRRKGVQSALVGEGMVLNLEADCPNGCVDPADDAYFVG
jgi:hypothetical protein